MAKQPRWYQEQAAAAPWAYIGKQGDAPVIDLPTGAGKSLTSAMLAKQVNDWGGRLLYVTYRKELVEQTEEAFKEIGLSTSVYSAGLKRRELTGDVLLGNIHSIYDKGCDLGPVDVVLVDEAQYIPHDGEGMYQQLLQATLAANPNRKLIGLTATPYRLDGGYIYGDGRMFDGVCFEVGVRELISQGYLSKLTSKSTGVAIETEGVGVRGGEYIASQLQQAVSSDERTIILACDEIVSRTKDRSSVLVFATGVDHGKAVMGRLLDLADDASSVGYIDGTISSKTRGLLIERFRNRQLKYLVNIDVLTVGFDAPNVDAIALLRPTLSPGLYYQMIGRGLRKCEGKSDCLILDFAGNVRRHGPIDKIKIEPKQPGSGTGEAPSKVCPNCGSIVLASARFCEDCSYVWPEPEVKHEHQADDASPLSEVKRTEWAVEEVLYQAYRKKGWQEGDRETLKVTYIVGLARSFSEWICVEHDGWARGKAEKWWQARADFDCPHSAEIAERYAHRLATPSHIVVEEGDEFPRIVDYTLAPAAESEPSTLLAEAAQLGFTPEESWTDDIPF